MLLGTDEADESLGLLEFTDPEPPGSAVQR
jgi:hypothetical protein